MTEKRPRSRRRKLLRIFLITAITLVLALVGGHIWFVHNARSILKQIVADRSHGKLKIELSQFSFDIFSNKLQIRQADLMSTDSVNQASTYHVTFRKLTLRVHSFWALLLERKLLLDSIKLHDPDITVTQWRPDTAVRTARSDLSVPQEMGKLYNSMLDALETFGVRRIIINNASLRLVNKMRPGTPPVVLTRIDFDLWHTGGRRDTYIANEQNVVLHTDHQSIDLPSGRHHISFKNFKLELFNKHVELDSCTITARATDSSKSSYSLFFDKLLLIGVDFDAMYRYNLIRADSVYCAQPFFDLNFEPPQNVNSAAAAKKQPPDFEKLVRELTGDLDLAFVGVKDAGIRININGERQRSLFNSSKDNFEMRGLRINADSSKPVVVQRFDMLVRDYHLYNADSSSAYTFDSIHFLNNKVVLNNFAVSTASDRFRQRDERDFHIPYFELTGIDWYELVFEQSLKAQEAVMYNPVIRFRKNPNAVAVQKKANLFNTLQAVDSIMTLNKVKIVNGELDAQLGHSSSVKIHDLDLSLFSNSLMRSKNREGIRRAVEYFSFRDGFFKFKDITAQLKNIRFTGNNLLHGDQLLVNSSTKRLHADVRDVYIDNLLLDEHTETVLLDGLRWGRATFDMQDAPKAKSSNGGGAKLRIKNIAGKNTKLSIAKNGLKVSTFVDDVRVGLLSREGAAPMHLDGLVVSGRDLTVGKEGLDVRAQRYTINGSSTSQVSGVNIRQVSGRDSVLVETPRVDLRVDVNEMLGQDLRVREIKMNNPKITLHKWNAPTEAKQSKKAIQVDRIELEAPVVDVALHRHDSATYIRVPAGSNSRLAITNLHLDKGIVDLGRFTLVSDAATLAKSTGQTFGVDKGKLDLAVTNIHLGQKDGKPDWSLAVEKLYLQNPNSLVLGKRRSRLDLKQATLGNFSLSSDNFSRIDQLLRNNVSASLHEATGQYIDSSVSLSWYNASYDAGKKAFRVDSFDFHPTPPRDTLVARTPYQIDYITFHSGPVVLSGFDLNRYKRDSALLVNTIDIQSSLITIFRDKQPPTLNGLIRPLPTDMIKQVPFLLQVQRINLIDGLLSYTEKNARTRAEGTLLMNRLNGTLGNIRNQGLSPGDSLLVSANAYLMDSAFIDLRVKESYTDTLSGFLMTLRMRPTSLSFLNPVLAPLSNVKITSGTIDSFRVRAIGRDDLAFGEMNMFYHNLRIKLVKNGDENQSSFFGNIASALVNTFFIRKNNNGRTGLIYYPRLRDRSFFNYIIKATFSGMATSVGVKKNRKYLKRYRRALESKHLPEIEL